MAKIKIIGGKFKGRSIEVLDVESLRPTPNRVRETLFNWLMHDINNMQCLDLFAGTGILGFEALSRGAKKVIFVEKNPKISKLIQNNLQSLNITSCELYSMEASKFLASQNNLKYDLIFLDPPFKMDIYPIIQNILAAEILNQAGLIYLEYGNQLENNKVPDNITILKAKQAGTVYYHLLQLN